MGFNLGNFGGQLSAEELQKAYVTAGGNPTELGLDQPVEAPPVDMSVQKAPGAPARAIASYQNQNLADDNARIEIAGRSGDGSGLDKQAHEERAGIYQRQATQSKALTDDAKSRVGERREHEAKYQKYADDLYEDMRQHSSPPGPGTMEKVMGIIGAVGAIGGKPGLAQGAQMLSSMLGSNSDRWAQEQAANSNLYKNALGMVSSDREGASHDLDVAQKMTALEAHEIDASLEAAKSQGLGRNAERIASDLQLRLREDTRNGLIKMEMDKQKAAIQKGKNAQEQYFWSIPLPQLQQMPSQILGEKGQVILAARNKNDQGFRENEAGLVGKELDAEKKRRELLANGGKGAPRTEYEGKVQAMVAPLAGPDGPIARLERLIYDENGVEKAPDKIDVPYYGTERGGSSWAPQALVPTDVLQHQADVNTLRQVFVRARSGAGIKETEAEDELRAMGIYSRDEKVAAQGMKQLVKSIRSLDKFQDLDAAGSSSFRPGVRGVAGGGPPAPRGPVQKAAPQVDPNAPVAMMDPTGRVYQVHPSRVGTLPAGWKDASGFDSIANRDRAEAAAQVAAVQPPTSQQLAYAQPTVAETAGKPVSEMTDAEYQAYVQAQGGY